MKRILAAMLTGIMLLALAACGDTTSKNPKPSATAAETAKAWIEKQIADNTLFSFEYDGKAFTEFIKDWEKKTDTGTDAEGNATYTLTYESPDGVTAWADIVFDADFAALEWVCYFKNDATTDSKVISNIQAMDSTCEVADPIFTTAMGSDPSTSDFEAFSKDLTETPEYVMRSTGGRSSQGAFPYYDISNGTAGIMGGIGWTGSWTASFNNNAGKIKIVAGMSYTNIALYAGEDMRTPAMLLMFFNGDQDAGHNQFRQLVLKSYTPSDETGEPIKTLPLTINNWGGAGESTLLSTIALADRVEMDYEVMWVDAGWYGDYPSLDTYDTVWPTQVGNWYVYEGAYPEGFINVSDALVERGKKLMLWFEPERAMPGTKLVTEHPEYFLKNSSTSTFELYNLASNEATDYLIDLIDNLIKENGIHWYRQDFNCDPYVKWDYQDSQEEGARNGMTEIKYITNLYRYIDTLIDRNPGLLMDNCASGGKRLDFEMMKRSVPLWRTDYTVSGKNNTSNCDGVRSIGYNLAWWLPLSCGGGASDGVSNNYQWRCQMSSGITTGVAASNIGWFNTMIEQYYQCRELMTGDYYILATGKGESYRKENSIYEFYTPETGEGFILAFRPESSKTAEQDVLLKGLDAEATYILNVVDYEETFEATGKQLMEEGLNIQFPAPATSHLIFINKK